MKTKGLIFTLLALLPAMASAEVCFYEHTNYEGNRFCLGSEEVVNNLEFSDWNDKISSISVDGFARVRVCQDAYFYGRCVDVTDNVANMYDVGMNDEVSSVEVIYDRWGRPDRPNPPSRPGGWHDYVCFYEHADYRGQEICMYEQELGIRNFEASGMNDEISSVHVPRGVSLVVCEHAAFGGRCLRVNRDVRNFDHLGFNDMISSARVERRGRW